MTNSWMKRSVEIQGILGNLLGEISESQKAVYGETMSRENLYAIRIAIIFSLLSEIDSLQPIIVDGTNRQIIKNVVSDVSKKIKKFAEGKSEEQAFILGELIDRILKSLMLPINEKLQSSMEQEVAS